MNYKVLDGLKWIVGVLNRFGIDYQITGGLAAFWYGSKREIYDIDLEVSDSDVYRLSEICREHIIYGPERYVDEHFDLLLMTLKYRDQLIDVCGIDNMSIRGLRQMVDLRSAVNIGGYRVVGLGDLIAYKKLLGREVDLIDIGFLE
jgi:hypothetical protein